MRARSLFDVVGQHTAMTGPGSIEATKGREIAAQAGMWNDDETRAFLASVAEVAALV